MFNNNFYKTIFVLISLSLFIISCSSTESETTTPQDTVSPPPTATPVTTKATQEKTETDAAAAKAKADAAAAKAKADAAGYPPVEYVGPVAKCEDKGTHIYCISSTLAPPTTEIFSLNADFSLPEWTKEANDYSPEVFCSNDYPVEACGWHLEALEVAISYFGHRNSIELWVVGPSVDARENLSTVMCNLHATKKITQRLDKAQCESLNLDRNKMELETFRVASETAQSQKVPPTQKVKYRGNRWWLMHYIESPIAIGFLNKDNYSNYSWDCPKNCMSGAEAQKEIFREVFHTIRQSFIGSQDWQVRDSTDTTGPQWWTEGAAEFLAQSYLDKARKDGLVRVINADRTVAKRSPERGSKPRTYKFEDNMKEKILDGLNNRKSTCQNQTLGEYRYCNNMEEDLGAWGVAYLNNKVGGFDWQAFYTDLETLGWNTSFVKAFGMEPNVFYSEFDSWLDSTNTEEKLAILSTPAPLVAFVKSSIKLPADYSLPAYPTVEYIGDVAKCEDKGTHTYCVSSTLAAPPATVPAWSSTPHDYSPEVYCSNDLPIDSCGWAVEGLVASYHYMGHRQLSEFWIIGASVTARENLSTVMCDLHEQKFGRVKTDCESKNLNSDYGLDGYRKISQKSIDTVQTNSGAGWNGSRSRGNNFFTASMRHGFLSPENYTNYVWKCPYACRGGADEWKSFFHENFHGVQASYIQSTDEDFRKVIVGPQWFHEGGAEFMAQYFVHKAQLDGRVRVINADRTIRILDDNGVVIPGARPRTSQFEDNMKYKLYDGLNNRKIYCIGYTLAQLDSSCHHMSYDLGSWAIAYLNHKIGGWDWEAFNAGLEEIGSWETAFTKTFGTTPDEFYVEFDAWLDSATLKEKMAILPTQSGVELSKRK